MPDKPTADSAAAGDSAGGVPGASQAGGGAAIRAKHKGGPGGDAKGGGEPKKKKESIIDLGRFVDKRVRVKFQGGREVSGILKGYDALLNLVLDNSTEYLRDPDDQYKLTEDTRQLGLMVARGTAVTVISPADGMEQIANPFVAQMD